MSSVQFNLLPDVKLEFNKAQHAKRVVYSLSTLAVGISIALFVISFLSVNVLQKKLLNDANSDINKYSSQLKAIPDLDKVLTVQNQLNSLPQKHQQKHIMSRLFTYLPQVTPSGVAIGKLSLDTSTNTMSIDGTASSIEVVNKFVDTLKFTNYIVDNDQSKKTAAFTSVILSKVDRSEKQASYTVTFAYDPVLFDATKTVSLVIPQETTTRSVLNSVNTSEELFNGQTGNPKSSGSNGSSDQTGGQ